MASILVRNLEDRVVRQLKQQAKNHGRSLQAEVKALLSDRLTMTSSEALKVSDYFHKKFAGRIHSDSVDLIREDRDSR